ncbi:hypothetical protein ACX27_26785 [Nostoc piscinale CENA21]|uniref:HTH cro/C1-type domain-containing protein n=1 Tax=Nostoc piscinale CENA21 TaxID=224013 RepID=A0A0M4SQ40_9NOSO|nr:helix-turn-helix domain-containing protein [Nostoc piscinale]ALF55635.1 hypothetical protein ACX27_26785 [Nostoc piscinale CENA21]
MKITLRLKELRTAHGHTQKFMANYLEMTETNYRRAEYNQLGSVKIRDLEKLCELFQCGVGDILHLEAE